MPWTIYCHTHIESGRRYVGLTVRSMERRWSQHVIQSRSTKNGRWHFPNAVRKYGPQAFSHGVLEVCETLEQANVREDYWIDFYDTRNPERGFNLAKGGQHTPHPIRRNPWDDPEYREKLKPTLSMKATRTPEARRKNAQARSAPEVRARWSKASKEMWADPAYKEKMRAVSRSHPAIRASRERTSEEARVVRESLTHIVCPEHGAIPIAECYGRRSSKGRIHYSCKPCAKRSSDRARQRRLERL